MVPRWVVVVSFSETAIEHYLEFSVSTFKSFQNGSIIPSYQPLKRQSQQ